MLPGRLYPSISLVVLLAMRPVYGGRWGPPLLRAGVISAPYGLLLLGVSVAFVPWRWLA